MPFCSRFMAGRGRFGPLHQETNKWGNRPFFLLLLLTTITAVIKSTAIFTSSPSPAPMTPPSPVPMEPPSPLPSPAPKLYRNQQQINNIIDALIGAGDFNSWADILSVADAADLPLSVTLFIPADESFRSTITIEPLVFLSHIVPQRLCLGLSLFSLPKPSSSPTIPSPISPSTTASFPPRTSTPPIPSPSTALPRFLTTLFTGMAYQRHYQPLNHHHHRPRLES